MLSARGVDWIMSGQTENLYRLRRQDVSKAGAVLTDAFRHDPLWRKLLAGSQARQTRGLFEIPVRYCLKYGQVCAVSENLEGVIAWVSGHLADMPIWRLVASGAIWPGLRVARLMAPQMAPVFMPIEADRKANMLGRPYIYLPVLGVAQAYQGQGFGGKLLSALVSESEQAGLPLYLETETESNVRWYERFGFKTVKQITLSRLDLPLWEMVREP